VFFQPCVGVVETPGVSRRVLLHLERRGCNTSGVSRLARTEEDTSVAEGRDGIVGGRHVGTFCYCLDRKSTRLNSSHVSISYAVFCLKKLNKMGNINKRYWRLLSI